MADSEAVRSRRKRQHAAGDHSTCRPGCLRVAGDGDMDMLVAATLAEFTDTDPLLRGLAVRLATLAVEGRGMPAVSAARALGELVAIRREAR